MGQLLLPIGVIMALAAAFQGFLWWKFNQELDTWIQRASPFVEIRYGSANYWLWGVFEVDELEVEIVQEPVYATISFDALRLEVEQWQPLLRYQLFGGDFPEITQFSFSIEGGRTDLDQYPQYAVQGSLDPYLPVQGPMACGTVTTIGPTELDEMGYTQWVFDMALSVELNPRTNYLTLEASQTVRDMYETRTEAGFSIPPALLYRGEVNPLALLGNQSMGRIVDRIGITTIDRSYLERKKLFCTDKSGQDIDAFVVNHVAQSTDNLVAIGLNPNDDAAQAYRQFLTEGGEFSLEIVPDENVLQNFMQIFARAADQPTSLRSLFGIDDVAVNGQLFEDFDISLNPAVAIAASRRGPFSLDGIAGQPEEPEEPEESEEPIASTGFEIRPVPPKTFHTVAIEELDNYLNFPARILVVNRRAPYVGKVESVDHEEEKVEIRIGYRGGSAVFFLPFDRIVKAEIEK